MTAYYDTHAQMMMAWYMVYDDEMLNELCLLLAEVYQLDEIGSLMT